MNWPEPILSAVRCYLGTETDSEADTVWLYLRERYGVDPLPDLYRAAVWVMSIELGKRTKSRYRSVDDWVKRGGRA